MPCPTSRTHYVIIKVYRSAYRTLTSDIYDILAASVSATKSIKLWNNSLRPPASRSNASSPEEKKKNVYNAAVLARTMLQPLTDCRLARQFRSHWAESHEKKNKRTRFRNPCVPSGGPFLSHDDTFIFILFYFFCVASFVSFVSSETAMGKSISTASHHSPQPWLGAVKEGPRACEA